MNINKGTPVKFQDEQYRVVRVVNGGRDIVIQDIDGARLTVSPLTVQIGW